MTRDQDDKQSFAAGEERFRLVVEAAPSGMIMVDQSGKIVLVNSQVERLFGYTREELLNQPIELLVPEASRAKHPDYRNKYFADPKTRSMGVGRDLYGLRKDGTEVPVEIGLNPLMTEGERFVLASIVDITERKRADRVLKESEERFRLLMSGVRDYSIILLDLEGKIVTWNEGAQRITGYQAEEIMGEHFSRFYLPEDIQSGKSERELAIATNEQRFEDEGWRVRKDGSRFFANVLLSALRDDDGKLRGFAKVTRDITEQKRSEERFRLVVEAAPSGMIMVDQSGAIVLVNSQVERLFGYSREELLGQQIEMLVPQASRAKHPGHRASFFAEPKVRSMGVGRDLYGLRKDGTEIPVEIGLNPLMTEGERFVLASVVDITERKRSQELLQENVVDLQRWNEELQQFAYVCSHDLQEPLRVISNYTQLLARRYTGQLDQSADEFIEFTVDAARRMQELINDLLLYSRVETRGQDFKDVDCSIAVEMALANLKVTMEESGGVIEPAALPTVKGDSSQLLQLFQNLLSNAIKFRSSKQPVIKITAQEQGTHWLFAVSDNGIGFDMKYAERIFIIFQRLHTKEMYPGSGIGLAICKKIVERHSGRMWVESQPGSGASFYFTIPKTSRLKGTMHE